MQLLAVNCEERAALARDVLVDEVAKVALPDEADPDAVLLCCCCEPSTACELADVSLEEVAEREEDLLERTTSDVREEVALVFARVFGCEQLRERTVAV